VLPRHGFESRMGLRPDNLEDPETRTAAGFPPAEATPAVLASEMRVIPGARTGKPQARCRRSRRLAALP